MDSGARTQPAPPAPPAPGVSGARRRPASPQPLRCGRRRRPRAEDTGGGEAAVARRNERERNRVKLVNLGFQALRQHVPRGGAGQRLSKVDTLRSAAQYIRALQRLLAQHDAVRAALAGGLPAPRGPPGLRAAPASPSCASSSPGRGGSSQPGSPRSACSSDDGGCEAALSSAERELLDFSSWLGGC